MMLSISLNARTRAEAIERLNGHLARADEHTAPVLQAYLAYVSALPEGVLDLSGYIHLALHYQMPGPTGPREVGI